MLDRAGGPGSLTVRHVADSADVDDYELRAREWGSAVWASWEPHHARVRAAVSAALAD